MSASSLLSSLCASKRDVLNRVKEVLEAYVESGLIDREDFKELAKKSVETIVPPAVVGAVEQTALERLAAFLSESGAREAAIAPIRDRITALAKDVVELKEKEEKQQQEERPPLEKQDGLKTLAPRTGLSLSALRARMAKKREELRRPREEAPTETDEATRETTPTATARGVLSTSPTGTQRSSAAADEAPPARKCKMETQTSFPPPKLHEIDLYADLGSSAVGWRL